VGRACVAQERRAGMSEGGPPFEPAPLPEHMEHSRKRGWAKMAEPLMASVPTLIGVLLGGIMSHFAETQRVDFEREDRFRREQIQRVATIAHGFDSLSSPLITMVGTVGGLQPAMCRNAHTASLIEQKLMKMGLLHEREFSPGNVDFTKTAAYGRELAAVPATNASAKSAANWRLAMLGGYADMLTPLQQANVEFYNNRKTFQATLMFEAMVYFPKPVQDEVRSVVDEYVDIDNAIMQLKAPNTVCNIDPPKIEKDLVNLSVRSSEEMIGFAQRLEPELGNSALQPDLPPREATQMKL
jgi:hypothetical protein